MKFLLIIQICSTLLQECTEPIEIYPLYNSHYDCATGGFLRGMTMVREIGEEEVNNKNILVNFACIKQESI
jgi:hypothetical protein